jgi:hypothetical protein
MISFYARSYKFYYRLLIDHTCDRKIKKYTFKIFNDLGINLCKGYL